MEKLYMKFSALNLDFDGSSVDFLGSRKPAHEGIKVVILSLSASFFVKAVTDRHGHAAYHNKH